LISQLTSPLDQITSNCRRSRRTNSNHSRYGTFATDANALTLRPLSGLATTRLTRSGHWPAR
jgi:hypothetical protein